MKQIELITDQGNKNPAQDLGTTFDVSPELRSLTKAKDLVR